MEKCRWTMSLYHNVDEVDEVDMLTRVTKGRDSQRMLEHERGRAADCKSVEAVL